MHLQLKPYKESLYKVNSLLIRGTTVHAWMVAIGQLEIDLQQVEAYAVPGSEPNSLFGCVLFFGNKPMPSDIQHHQYLQYAANKLLLPERSIYLPAVDEEEISKLAPGKKILLHPAVGTVLLEQPIAWETRLNFSAASTLAPVKPTKGVGIPGVVNSFMVELNDEELIEELTNPISEKELIGNLPFDMKKLMQGNQREMEKYLKYLETNPDKALNLALPLNVLGTSRGDNKGRFSFSGTWLQRLFGSNNQGGGYSGSSSKGNFWWVVIIAIAFIKIMTCNVGRPSYIDRRHDTIQVVKKSETVLDSHYNSIMEEKIDLLLNQQRSGAHPVGEQVEEYKTENLSFVISNEEIRDSLVGIYIAMSKRKTDSVVKTWKKHLADSLGIKDGNIKFQEDMQTAIASKRKATYKAYATYYGVDDDDLFAYQKKEREDLPKAKVRSEYKSVLYLTLFLIVLAILYGTWKAPESSNGKISLGQGELSSWSILMVFIIMIGAIAFILKPLLHSYGFGWLTIIVCLIIVALLYRLFGRELTILDPKNEKK